jgi:hypothetical protein
LAVERQSSVLEEAALQFEGSPESPLDTRVVPVAQPVGIGPVLDEPSTAIAAEALDDLQRGRAVDEPTELIGHIDGNGLECGPIGGVELRKLHRLVGSSKLGSPVRRSPGLLLQVKSFTRSRRRVKGQVSPNFSERATG